MEILLEPTSNKLMVGFELTIDDEFLKRLTLSMCHKTTLASDMSIDFQMDFSISIGETVTQWFTLVVLSTLRSSDNENMLSLMNLIHSEWLHDTYDEPKYQELEAHNMYMEKIQEVLTANADNNGPTYDNKPLEKVQSNNDYNVFATKRDQSKQHESNNDTYVVEKVDSNVTSDSSDMSTNEREVNQNVEKHEDENVLLVS
nr:hypothetical protein [Tanacetum cinerariifolium]